jgi:hypothetical protein
MDGFETSPIMIGDRGSDTSYPVPFLSSWIVRS